MHKKPKQQSNQSAVAKAHRIEKELSESPELVDALLENGQFLSMVQTSFSGPLPPPDVIRGYDQILPGGAERIFSMAEKEQAHRHKMDSTAVNGAIRKDKRGQWMGFSIAITILAIASVFAWRGNTAFAGTLIAIDLIGLVSVFVLGRRASKSDD